MWIKNDAFKNLSLSRSFGVIDKYTILERLLGEKRKTGEEKYVRERERGQ